MIEGTFSLLALARPRAPWLADLTRWANSGALEVDLIRCVSIDEVRARLNSLQSFSALVIDENSIGLDRDLLGAATDAGCASLVITSGIARRDWAAVGADRVLDAGFTSEALLSSLRAIAAPSITAEYRPAVVDLVDAGSRPSAPMFAVTGAGGTGTSIIALALAQSLPDCALVDAALDASLALLIGDVDVVPSLQELVEAHRTGTPSPEEIRRTLQSCQRHRISLLPGLRRHRDWTALRPRAIEATIASLRHAFAMVVADIDSDVEGEPETGSFDIADRNALARYIASSADVVVITGRPDLAGLSRIVSTVANFLDLGVEPDRIIPVVMRSSRCILSVNEIRRSITTLLGEIRPVAEIATAAVIEPPKDLDALLLDGSPLPKAFAEQVLNAVPERLRAPAVMPRIDQPVAVVPGSLGIAS
jgi:MinD-like ATPase involved in chromosome partitioning or flagellar assembly